MPRSTGMKNGTLCHKRRGSRCGVGSGGSSGIRIWAAGQRWLAEFRVADVAFVADRKLMAALSAPASEHRATVLCFHALAETVSFGPLPIIRLKRTFWHFVNPERRVQTFRARREGVKFRLYIRGRTECISYSRVARTLVGLKSAPRAQGLNAA